MIRAVRTINGPDNVTVQMNGSATFNVLASVLWLSIQQHEITSGSSVCRARKWGRY